ncbi:GtrA family protein [Acetobacter sp. TBRC 12305]|uniref:GtrA family protein n=1 Tax=Acetobacter garciniae TaxID=2817435 RepID=A0A939HMU4_9PROT|nr:GtrA family protein [Acetobacter garciniae]MBO1323794.1 GtrA family protein [Acetobacter garciniae]MBX0343483.1 GtrA family protein [Acetobacter garciniae]
MTSLLRQIPDKQKALRLFKFGVVGTLGLVWDTGSVYALRPLLGLTLATLAAYFIAATANWFLNRLWTFRGVGLHQHILVQWLRFLTTNSLGFLLNRGTVYTLFLLFPLCRHYPVVALAAGALAGLFSNFHICQKMVFREHPAANCPEQPTANPQPPAPEPVRRVAP